MYAAFFGLQHLPFSIAPDPRYLYLSERHREALAHLLYGLDGGGGFVLLTGEVGTGKTTVCRCFLQQIPAHCTAAYIFNPRLTALELLGTICDEFGVAHPPAVPGKPTAKDCIDPLNTFLLSEHAAGRSCVLIIDEAQSLAPDVLEQLRLLTNLETDEKKLLQIILIGQPELRDMVASPGLTQLAQRVIARYHLGPLSAAETQEYIAHRMAVAGGRGAPPFSRKALERVHALSQGVPRRINLLCDRALLGAYSAGQRQVSDAVLQRAATEVFGSASVAVSRPVRWNRVLVDVAIGVALVVAALMVWYEWPRQTVTVPPSPVARQPAQARSAQQLTLDRMLGHQSRDASPLWQRLVRMWGASVPAGMPPCGEPLPEGLQCWRGTSADVQLLRELDRPVLLTLQPVDGTPVMVLLRSLAGDRATIEDADGTSLEVSLPELAQRWPGGWLAVWRSPPQWKAEGDMAATREGASWLARQFDRADVPAAPSLRMRIEQFQKEHGLQPDGAAGSLTLMQLNRALGVSEPRLTGGSR